MTQMTIREKGYHRWDGQLQPSVFPWLPMFFNGIKAAFRKRFAKGLFIFCATPFMGFLIAIWVSSHPEVPFFKDLARIFMRSEPGFFNTFLTNGYTTFLLILMGAFIGAELISQDVKFNSFPLYFARPLVRKDYMLGKFSILMFYFLLFSAVPGILLYIFKIIFTGKFAIGFHTLLGLIFVPLVVAFYIASIVLLLSSFSRNARNVKIFIFIVYFFSWMTAKLLEEIFDSAYFYLLSIPNIMEQVGTFIFNVKSAYRFPGWTSLAVMMVVSLAACFILYHRIRKLEAQIESSN